MLKLQDVKIREAKPKPTADRQNITRGLPSDLDSIGLVFSDRTTFMEHEQ
jgi:hypothetical protein